ncbi:LLM class flavin-dependent oxidoreductase [Streptomyces sp. LN325]|uniref:LLM class flavin-dependent oxidoreductase n=1 Tax=Streptomyces sp. LN325 TaxID=3112976 RepID=UPI003716E4C4
MTSLTPRFRLGFLTHVQGRGDDLTRTYRNAQELFVVADELGFDTGWVAQHHVQAGGGGLSSPWTFLAHAAARTTRIRLGTAITVLPLEDPVRLAEDVAVVDTLSGGRVEIGVGSGYNDTEYAAFGQDVARKRELTSEKLSVLRGALAAEEVRTPGFRIQPAPGDFTDRIWQGLQRPRRTARRRGRLEPPAQPGGVRLRRPYRRGAAPLGGRVPRRLGPAAPATDRAVPVRVPREGQTHGAPADRRRRPPGGPSPRGGRCLPEGPGRGRGAASIPLLLRPSR